MIYLSNHQLDGILNTINDFMAHLVLTVGMMRLFPDGKSSYSYLSCTKCVGSDTDTIVNSGVACLRRLTTIAIITSPE